MLVNKIANAYRSARGKEKVAYSNFRRGVEVPQALEQTNSQVFENIKNVYDDIGIDTPLPKANITPYNEAFAKNQAQNSEFIKGDGFRMQREPQYQAHTPKEQPNNGEMASEIKQIPFKPNLLPNQNLKAPITTDDIFKEVINLHRSGFKFGKDINENINLVLNKIKNDRLNTTSAKNAQVPNNRLLPPPKEPMHNPNWYDEFVKNKPANVDMDYLKTYYDVDGFLNDRANVLAKDIRYNNRQIELSKIVDNQGYGGWEYKRTRQITEPNYNADFQITKADVNAIKNGTATNQTIQKLADDLEASKYLGYGYDNFSKNVDSYLTSLEQRGIKPELVSSLRQKLVNEPELFTAQRIKETEEFIKNNPNLVLKNPNMKGGFITPNLAKDMASSGIGAGIGANLDEENRFRGAMLGGLGGLAGRHMFSQMPKLAMANNNIKNEMIKRSEVLKKDLMYGRGGLNKQKIKEISDNLPKKFNSLDEFEKSIGTKGDFTIDTPIEKINTNTKKIWKHMAGENTYLQDRVSFSGAFMDTVKPHKNEKKVFT
ncbi:hypothetical protein CYJ41_01520 [Campylobacter ureolyticus]|uniref:Uncharacterized protein n=1 Tax=Campylobacter ureolyticus TaxID=827 RepID=A0A2I1NCN7_9BACT|nr:hypothetical protein [Campylobacter ureolyticus]PKZ30147.1 hypothetical protein CYJ41_01520 [Campylobacter ureolyticus]